MKVSAIVCALTAASLGFSTLSFAQGYERHDAREEMRQDQHHGPNRYERQAERRMEHRNERFDFREERHNDRFEYYNARGPEFRRGGHIPREFRNRQYVINDYRMYNLPPPPRGHQWVQVGADYVLIAIATGLIVNILLNN